MASKDAMAIDPKQPIPLYFQLKTLLLEGILSGQYGVPPRTGYRPSTSCARATSSVARR